MVKHTKSNKYEYFYTTKEYLLWLYSLLVIAKMVYVIKEK